MAGGIMRTEGIPDVTGDAVRVQHHHLTRVNDHVVVTDHLMIGENDHQDLNGLRSMRDLVGHLNVSPRGAPLDQKFQALRPTRN